MSSLNPSPIPNIPATQAQLTDLLDLRKKDTFLSLFSHGIATITAFDPDTMTASAAMAYSQTFMVRNSDGTNTNQQRDYPPLVGCPVIFLGGVSSYLTFPDVVGAEALVIFNDRDIDNWFANQGAILNSSRLHSFSDAFLLVGPRSLKNVISGFDTNRILMKKGNAELGVGLNNELVRVANELYTLNGLLQQLVTAIQNITVICAGNGSPSGKPINSATFTTIAGKLSQLLE